ncbi:hypothetical protein [Wolbachia endosymbiont (group A) of Myopa testacea]|uniref:hypothetical protein n=1 Tax=Wolbachia endosymbiont (group A) of Myopa testacea TaxID=3066148 RepID=UPI0031332198
MIFEVVGSAEQLKRQLQKYKDKLVGHNRRSLALIINLGRSEANPEGSHWVTLVVTSHNQQSLSAYYIDSLGNNAPSWINEVVMGEGHSILSFPIRQQEDSFNC